MFGTKVLTATYYRSHCGNSLYYRTSRDHGLYCSTSCCISQCPVHYPVKLDADNLYPVRSYWHFSFHIPKHPRWRRPPSWIFRLCEFGYSGMLILLYLCSVPNLVQVWLCYSHGDRRTYSFDDAHIHLMTSRELTSGFDFWSRGHLCMAVMHLPIKFDADIYIQSEVNDMFPKFKMAAAAILDLQVMRIWPLRYVDSVVFVLCTKLGSNHGLYGSTTV